MDSNYNLTNKYVSIKTSTLVTLSELFIVQTLDGPITLEVEIWKTYLKDIEKYS
jgi:hypothetical protein